MAIEDWIDEQESKRRGGQGSVIKVRHRVDGRIGALKTLHPEAQGKRERRYRFLQEVSALKALAGDGTPLVFEANEGAWDVKTIDLYLVMEFVAGPTMEELTTDKAPTMNEALLALKRVVEVLGRGHQMLIFHRDVKHNNIILRNGVWSDPVIVDLGMAFSPLEDEASYNTPAGQELGNRFLRLPEFAPNGQHRDARSDLAMAAGLLFYMLSGAAPRVLVDHRGLLPHERGSIQFRAALMSDPRWNSVLRFFHVAFQNMLHHRYQTAQEMLDALTDIQEGQKLGESDLEDQVAKLKALMDGDYHRERVVAGRFMEESSLLLSHKLRELWEQAGLTDAPVYPQFNENGQVFSLINRVSRLRHSDPHVWFHHDVALQDGRLVATWWMDDQSKTLVHNCSAADGEGLKETILGAADNIAARVIERLAVKLEPPASLLPFFQ